MGLAILAAAFVAILVGLLGRWGPRALFVRNVIGAIGLLMVLVGWPVLFLVDGSYGGQVLGGIQLAAEGGILALVLFIWAARRFGIFSPVRDWLAARRAARIDAGMKALQGEVTPDVVRIAAGDPYRGGEVVVPRVAETTNASHVRIARERLRIEDEAREMEAELERKLEDERERSS